MDRRTNTHIYPPTDRHMNINNAYRLLNIQYLVSIRKLKTNIMIHYYVKNVVLVSCNTVLTFLVHVLPNRCRMVARNEPLTKVYMYIVSYYIYIYMHYYITKCTYRLQV